MDGLTTYPVRTRTLPPGPDRGPADGQMRQTAFRPRLLATGIAVVAFVVALWSSPAFATSSEVRLTPEPPDSHFVYIGLSAPAPASFNSSYIGVFHVQFNYAHPSLQWSFTIAQKWQVESQGRPVQFTYLVFTDGKQVNNYRPHTEAATYLFHSSVGASFQFTGDAPWTSHSLHPAETIDIMLQFSYVLPGATIEHSFWGDYRIGIR
jgi:hypothetical protein